MLLFLTFSWVREGEGGAGVLRISSDGDDQRIFGGLKFLFLGFLGEGKFG